MADPAASFHPQGGLPSPGMMPRHYAPRAKLVLTDGREKALAGAIQERAKEKVGALVPSGWSICAAARFDWGSWGDWAVLASRLYAGLRWLDEQKLDLVAVPLASAEGLGGAIRERLLKASGGAMCPPLGGSGG